MTEEQNKIIMYYYASKVKVIMADGQEFFAVVTGYTPESVQLDNVEYPSDAIEDILYVGDYTGATKNKQYGWINGTYRFAFSDCRDEALVEKVLYGEFHCQLLCHLQLEGDSIMAKDVSLFQASHAFNEELLCERTLLYRIEGQPFQPANYEKEEDVAVLRLPSGDTIAFEPEHISCITKMPQINNRVAVTMMGGTRYEGVVCVSNTDFFILADNRIPPLHYSALEDICYFATVDVDAATQEMTVKRRYHVCLPYSDLRKKRLSQGAEICYRVSMNENQLLAKVVSISETEEVEEVLTEHMGIICFCDISKKNSVGYIGDRYIQGQKSYGTVIFQSHQLDFTYVPWKVYVVRYFLSESSSEGGRMPSAKKLELVQEFIKDSYDEIKITPEGEIHTVEHNSVLYAIDFLLQKKVDVICGTEVHNGYLLENHTNTLVLGQDLQRTEPLLSIEKKQITQVRGYGRVTAYYDGTRTNRSGFGYIDEEFFFHINSLHLSQRGNMIPSVGMEVSYQLIRTDKNNRVAAADVLCIEKEYAVGYVVGCQDGLYTVLRETDYYRDRGTAEKIMLPAAKDCIFGDLTCYDYKVKILVERGDDGSAREISVEQVTEHLPKLYFGYILRYLPMQAEKAYGFLVNEEQYGRTSRGIYFQLTDIKNPPPRIDTKAHRYYLSYRLSIDGRARDITILQTTPLSEASVQKLELPQRQPEQSLTAYLNNATTFCLQNNLLNEAEQLLEQYQSEVDREFYLMGLYRIFDKKYKDTEQPDEIMRYIACVEELLLLTTKTAFKMTLLLRQGDLLYRLGEPERARQSYEQWQALCHQLLELYPDKAENYSLWQKRVAYKLALCSGEKAEPVKVTAVQEEPIEDLVLQTDFVHRYEWIDGRLQEVSLAKTLGKEWHRFEELAQLNDKQWLELCQLLEQSEEQLSKKPKAYWGLAKIYNQSLSRRNSSAHHSEKRDSYLYQALLYTAQDAITNAANEDAEAAKRRSQYACALALELSPRAEQPMALYFARDILTDERLKQRIHGQNFGTLRELISQEFKPEEVNIERLLVDSIILAARGAEIKDAQVGALADTEQGFRKLYCEALCSYLGLTEAEAAGNRVMLNEQINEAVKQYCEVKEQLTEANTKLRLHSFAAHKLKQLTAPEHKFWLQSELNRLDQLYQILKNLEDYDSQKGFHNKSRIAKNGIVGVKRMLDAIEAKPSCIAYEIFVPLLQELYFILKSTYKSLCQTTKPQLHFMPCDDVYASDEGLVVDIPVRGTANSGQTASNVRLKLQSSPQFKMLTRDIRTISQFPADNELRYFSFRIEPTDPDCEYITLRAQLSYDCIADVQFEEKVKNRRDSGGYREVVEQVVLDYEDIDITVNRKPRPPIDDRHMKLFSNDYVKENGNEEIKDILENRRQDIDKIICLLTDGTESLMDMPQWVILYGQWRVGKSTVLHTVENRLRERYPDAVLLSMECPGDSKGDFKQALAEKLYSSLRKFIRGCKNEEIIAVFEETSEAFIHKEQKRTWDELCDFMSAFSDGIRQKNSHARLILLLDEFTRIYQAILRGNVDSGFLEEWPEFVNDTNILVVTAGGEHTLSMIDTYAPNTLQKAGNLLRIRYLSREHVEKYVHFVVDNDDYFGSGVKSVMDRIYKLTQGNAFLLKQLCENMITYVNDNKIPYISTTVLDKTIDSMARMLPNADAVETFLFNSLYNPFNESDQEIEISEEVRRIEDDEVRVDNLKILHGLVKVADPESHICTQSDLALYLYNMPPKIFEKRLEMLIYRGIVERLGDTLRVVIDLYYEIVSRRQDL